MKTPQAFKRQAEQMVSTRASIRDVEVPSESSELSETGLRVTELSTAFHTEHGVVQAVDSVSLSVSRGELLAVVGESGSGKSVLSRSIMQLLPRRTVDRSGSVLLDGTELTSKTEREMRSLWGSAVSMIFQDPMTALNPVMRVGNQIDEILVNRTTMSKPQRREKCLQLMREVGIPEPAARLRQYPHQLSGGMRQRVMIAIALALDPKVLIADEPTTALDVTIQAQVMELLKREQVSRKMSIILITHDMGVAATYADRVVVMYAGQIVESGPTETVFVTPASPYTEALRASTPKLEDPPHTPLRTISGRPPLMTAVPAGCRFATRCVYAQDVCLEKMPPLITSPHDTRHEFRCHFPVGSPENQAALVKNQARGRTSTGLVISPSVGERVDR